MNKCYLVVISRNKWSDYELVTDLPATLESDNIPLKRRVKGFFPLDYADRKIVFSEKVVDSTLHLQSWCGRIESFAIDEIPYLQQIGRPIKLGVGILQELITGSEYVLYQLDDIKSLLSPLIREYQREPGSQPKQIELQGFGIKGELVSWKNFDKSDDDFAGITNKSNDWDNGNPIRQSSYQQENLFEARQSLSPTEASFWIDDLSCIYEITVRVFKLLDKQPHCHQSSTISHFLSYCNRRLGPISKTAIETDWRAVFKFLVDAWNFSLDIRISAFKLNNRFWQHNSRGFRDATMINILNQQLGIMAELLDEGFSLDSIEFRFDKISYELQAALLSLLDQ